MAAHAEAAEIPKQLMRIIFIIITQSTLFSSDIHKWHEKHATAKTWPPFLKLLFGLYYDFMYKSTYYCNTIRQIQIM